MPSWRADILMYHSISDAPGPTSIAPDVFAGQMKALAESGLPVISLDTLAGTISDETAPRSVVITFDDGFCDFADTAWPILRDYGFCPVVYLPTGLAGRHECWAGCENPPRPIMDWDTIGRLADEGVVFGGHSVMHPDLTALNRTMLEKEIADPRTELETRLGRAARHFAPPYGSSSPLVRRYIARHYATSVGTRLGIVRSNADPYDLPRLEMHYFTDILRWETHLAGHGRSYLIARRTMRRIRQACKSVERFAPLSRR